MDEMLITLISLPPHKSSGRNVLRLGDLLFHVGGDELQHHGPLINRVGESLTNMPRSQVSGLSRVLGFLVPVAWKHRLWCLILCSWALWPVLGCSHSLKLGKVWVGEFQQPAHTQGWAVSCAVGWVAILHLER